MRVFTLIGLIFFLTQTAAAQDRRPSHCIALAQNIPGAQMIHRASFKEPLPNSETVRLTYINHATFLLQTHGGISAATDYTGYLGAVSKVPDVVTMNHAHGSHWTRFPNPDITHVLEGWRDDGTPADHHLDLDEMLIRNVSTDIRSRFSGQVEEDGNSIFVFEVAGLCIGHLGHLHHEPDAAQYAALGRLDVVMAAADGGLSLDTVTMARVLTRLRSSIVIPMHGFGRGSLDSFVSQRGGTFAVVEVPNNFIEVSARNLPSQPTIMVIDPAYHLEPEE
jgi:L-ascorbate metabolism protein UlaG (beta-lactamase superfamily)